MASIEAGIRRFKADFSFELQIDIQRKEKKMDNVDIVPNNRKSSVEPMSIESMKD